MCKNPGHATAHTTIFRHPDWQWLVFCLGICVCFSFQVIFAGHMFTLKVHALISVNYSPWKNKRKTSGKHTIIYIYIIHILSIIQSDIRDILLKKDIIVGHSKNVVMAIKFGPWPTMAFRYTVLNISKRAHVWRPFSYLIFKPYRAIIATY